MPLYVKRDSLQTIKGKFGVRYFYKSFTYKNVIHEKSIPYEILQGRMGTVYIIFTSWRFHFELMPYSYSFVLYAKENAVATETQKSISM